MSFELPQTWRGGDELQNLTIDIYDDRFSAYWYSSKAYDEFVDIAENEISLEAEALLEAGEDSLDANFSEIVAVDPDHPKLLVIYGDRFSLSWELTSEDSFKSEVGVTADNPDVGLLVETFDDMEGVELSKQSVEAMEEFLTKHVHS